MSPSFVSVSQLFRMKRRSDCDASLTLSSPPRPESPSDGRTVTRLAQKSDPASVEATGRCTGLAQLGGIVGTHSDGVERLEDGFMELVRALRTERPGYCTGFKPWQDVSGGDA